MKEGLDIETMAERGVELCRQGNWKRGLEHLVFVAESGEKGALPGRYYSYLGYGIARFQGQLKKGLDLCRHGVRVELYCPENHLNLARTYLLIEGMRGKAFHAIREGLRFDPAHRELRQLLDEADERRKPLVPFLERRNPLNRSLGRLRHGLLAEKR